jgi:pyruvate/2-oxoglutarate dehydrogenase complex dihydrolipoamide dehydrogenase (E3) component
MYGPVAQVVLAVGRAGKTRDLGLEEVGVELGACTDVVKGRDAAEQGRKHILCALPTCLS